MKIVYLAADNVPMSANSGAGVRRRETIAALARQGHQVLPLLSADSGGASRTNTARSLARVKRLVPLKIRSFRRDIAHFLHDFRFAIHIFKKIKEFRPDVILERSTYMHISGLVLAKLFRIPYLIEINGRLADDAVVFYGSPLRGLGEKLEAWKYQQADAVLTIGGGLAAYVRSLGVPNNHVFITYNGVNPEYYQELELGRHSIRAKYDLKDKIVLGFIGHMLPWKGLPFLMECAPKIINADPRIVLMIVGPISPQVSLSEVAFSSADESRYIFVGEIRHQDVPNYVSAMDVCLLPDSLPYTVNVKFFEYGAAGKPVVAPRYPTIEDLFQDGETGILFEPKSKDDFIQSVLRLTLAPAERARIGAKWKDTVLRQYTWDAITKRTVDIINETLLDRRSLTKVG